MIDLNSAVVAIDTASAPYLGQWHRLVSTTNWEKGRIIQEWRTALSTAGTPAAEYADEAWSRRVGNVTGQHVGRLRRVFERFGAVAGEYSGLYWSHFQSALDWEDAEMWLEGAVQSRWSVAEMRRQRFSASAEAEGRATDEDTPSSDSPDEDFAPLPCDVDEQNRVLAAVSGREMGSDRNGHPMSGESGDGDRRSGESARHRSEPSEIATDEDSSDADDSPAGDQRGTVKSAPFANLVELPEDLAEAFESFKLAIVRHRLAGWHEAARDDVLAALDALRELALAPVE